MVLSLLLSAAHRGMTITLSLLQMREEKLGEANWSTRDTQAAVTELEPNPRLPIHNTRAASRTLFPGLFQIPLHCQMTKDQTSCHVSASSSVQNHNYFPLSRLEK